MKSAIRYIAVNPQGEIFGPVGTKEFVKEALIIGMKRVFNIEHAGNGQDEWLFERITRQGYTIRKAKIILLEES